jgi:PEP-CTERM motif
MLDAYGTWWGGNDEGPSQVYTFNPSTAAVTAGSLVTGTTSNFWGLAVVPVPEPSTWAMMALGFAGYRRARLAASIS